MPNEVIGAKEGFKGCLFIFSLAVAFFILSAAGYLFYLYYLDDSLPTN